MSYFIEIILTEPHGPDKDIGPATQRLPTKYEDVEEAGEAALEYIQASGLPPGSISYNIVDHEGRNAITLADPTP